MNNSTAKEKPKMTVKNGVIYGDALSAQEKKRIVMQKKKDRKAKKVRKSAQQTIPYVEMCRDGICKVNNRLYTKSIAFEDINYQLAENWCDFLNYFDSSIFVQLSFINQKASLNEFRKRINIPAQEDDFNDIRSEYSGMLQSQLTKGNNGLVKKKYITFGIDADNNFKTLGVRTEPLSGYERLKVLHDVFNMDTNEPFRFSFDMVARTGLSTKDFIAPTSFDFREGKCFKMGRTIGAVSFLQILAPELNDRMLADFLEMDSNITVNFHIRTIDQAKAIKSIKSKITDLDKMKIEEQKKAVRSGYDMDIIPSDLATFGGEAKRLLQDLQTRNERLFLVTILIMNTATNRQKLENAVFQTAAIAQKYNCALKRLDFQQEEGLMSSLPIGVNQVEIERGLTTSSTAVFVPFTTQELFQGGEALYYGLNALSNNMIMVDRKQLKNPNGLILGTPGSGKSFSAKREMTNAFLITEDDIIVCDPEAEYFPLVQKLGGQVIRISPVSTDYINPLDINTNYSEEENPLTLKSDFILSMCELIVGGKDGLQPVEKTIIDRSVRMVYQEFLADPKPEKMPILEDLYNILRNQKEPEAQRIATALEIYVHGSLNVFNHRTNVDVNNRFVCYDIRELGKQLKKLGMLIVQDQVWNRVTINRAQHKATRYYMDEFHLLLKEEQTAAYSVEIWKRFRKWGGIPTGITQNVKDLLASREVENIFENSDFVYLLNKMITIPYADAIEYGENTSALFKALWELTDLIRLESDLKKHHRAYLHVREDIDEKVKEARQIMPKVSVDMIGFYFKVDVPKCSNSDENTPFADAADDETVSTPKDEYELMIDDLLTMSEIIQCVADMRTQDVKAIREFGKFVPAFAAFEKNRLSLYREAAKEAEEIFDRWADEIDDFDEDFMEDENYEPDEYYSD